MVDTTHAENAAALSRFAYDLDSLSRVPEVDILDVSTRGCFSWEGSYSSNLALGRQRAQAVINFIKHSFDVNLTVNEYYDFESEFIDLISESGSDYTDKVLSILKSSDTKDKKTQALKSIDSGRCWEWLRSSVFPAQRRVDIVLRYSVRETVTTPPVVSEPTVIEEVPIPVKTEEPIQKEDPVALTVVAEPEQQSERHKSEFRLGTNLLYDVATVANLDFEAGFAPHMAVNLSVTFSPWDIKRPNIKLRTLIFQPEFRWYFTDNFKGHYVGAEAHFGWYNVALGGKTRYQDRDGSTPLWGVGLSYGYVLEFNEHLGMDFGVSAGYARLVSDCFYNVENGVRFTTATRNWFGPTKLGISIYYKF